MTLFPSIIAFYALFFICILFALARGGGPERSGALAYLGLAAIQVASTLVVRPFYSKVDGVGLLIDSMALIIFGALALSAKRIWPIWAASLQLLALAAHFSRWIELDVEPYVYSLMKSSPTAFALVALTLGTHLHRLRLKRYGTDPDWVNWKSVQVPA